MKKKLIALALVLVMIPLAAAVAAEAGFAMRLNEDHYAVIGGEQTITIRSSVSPGGKGGYCNALYPVELTGDETPAELDALALELIGKGVTPVWGGGKHCYHGGDYTVEPEYTLRASSYEPGGYLYVCYAFGCAGGDYNHVLTPYYERISTMAVQVTEKAEGLALRYALLDEKGNQTASLVDGDTAELDLNGGKRKVQIVSDTAYPVERIVGVEAGFGKDEAPAFTFDETTLTIDPVYCGSGSITVTIGNYLDDGTRTETIFLDVPCVPEAELTVLVENTCTEDGTAAHLCHGHGVNCETIFDEQVVPASGHELFSVSQYIEKPTATLPGLGMGTCKKCGVIGVEQELPPIFSDVVSDGFYSQALDYCYAKGWVTGVTADTFAPNNACVRAQVVTFLWRAAGCPEPENGVNPFVDVAEDAFYYDAVLWAVEMGITTGTDADHFSPMGVCNRAQVVTFLWRACGQPEAENQEHPFTDVQSGSWYEMPVLWAVEEGITSGMSAESFGPNADCNRAQIVTFLYRAYAE